MSYCGADRGRQPIPVWLLAEPAWEAQTYGAVLVKGFVLPLAACWKKLSLKYYMHGYIMTHTI